jgi:DNA-directed RNA polymerase specialized sigma24 family protein
MGPFFPEAKETTSRERRMGVIRRNQGADPEQIEAIYREHLADFRRVAAAIVGDVERGSDAVQEAFGNALRKRKSFRGEGSLEAWLWRLVVNPRRAAWRAVQVPAAGAAGNRGFSAATARSCEIVPHRRRARAKNGPADARRVGTASRGSGRSSTARR